MESASSGLLAGLNLARRLSGQETLVLPETTMLGALARYVAGYQGKDFQPMGANFGVLPPCLRKYGTSASGMGRWPSGGFPTWRAIAGRWASPWKKAPPARKWRRSYENHCRRLWRDNAPSKSCWAAPRPGRAWG